jgi:transposase InsO family protein
VGKTEPAAALNGSAKLKKCRPIRDPTFTMFPRIYHVDTDIQTTSAFSHTRKPGKFKGAILDSGASRSVIGFPEARRYCRAARKELDLVRTRRTFSFGSHISVSRGSMTIRISTPGGVLEFNVDVVDEDIPLLIGVDVLDRFRLQILTVSNELECVGLGSRPGWRLPLERTNGHVLLPFEPGIHELVGDNQVLFSTAQLQKLHRQLYHPSATKLFNLLRRARIEDLPADTRSTLDQIVHECGTCQKRAPRPMNFRIRIPDDVVFNRRVLADIMYIHGKPVLHVIDAGTAFQSARFLEKVDVTSVWNGFMECWSRLFIGDPEELVTDQGSVFISKTFEELCRSCEILLIHTGTESHNSLAQGERFHDPLRRTYQKLQDEQPDCAPETLLQCALFAINSTAGPEGLVPCLLVFGSLPRVPGLGGIASMDNSKRLALMQTVRTEYERVVAQLRIRVGLDKNVPAASDENFTEGDQVYLYRDSPVSNWTGPHTVIRTNGKDAVLVVDGKGERHFNVAQLKKYCPPTTIHWIEIPEPGDASGNQR